MRGEGKAERWGEREGKREGEWEREWGRNQISGQTKVLFFFCFCFFSPTGNTDAVTGFGEGATKDYL